MQSIFNLIFDNFIIILIGVLIFFVYKQYKDLKNRSAIIYDLFTKSLLGYIDGKINEAKSSADEILAEYGHNDVIATDVKRLIMTLEKGINGGINDKVETCNAINKFRTSKSINLEKFPKLNILNALGTFDEVDMESLDNGLAISRKEYNAQAFRYNEKASNFPIQYLVKYLKLNSQYAIFDQPKSAAYDEIYEVFEEEEPEINSLTSLNRSTITDEELNDLLVKKEDDYVESDLVIKPSTEIVEDKEEY